MWLLFSGWNVSRVPVGRGRHHFSESLAFIDLVMAVAVKHGPARHQDQSAFLADIGSVILELRSGGFGIRRGDHGHHGENCLTVLPFPAALRRQLFWAIPGEPGEGTLLPE